MNMIKEMLKNYLPASSKTINSRLDHIEEKLENIQFFSSPMDQQECILIYSCWANIIHDVHMKSFGPYKNFCHNRDIVIIGTGPSINFFTPIKNAVYIGVNHAYRVPNIVLDFLFVQDFGKGHVFSLDEIEKLECIKFIGKHCAAYKGMVNADAPEEIFQWPNVKKYYVNHVLGPAGNTPLMVDIEYFPLMDCWSTIFSAIEFAFYMHPKRIFLAGCDTGTRLGGHFDGRPHQTLQSSYDWMYEGYLQVKEFAEIHYPDTEIVSVNPVRLKGLFTDQYTDPYLQAYPGEVDPPNN